MKCLIYGVMPRNGGIAKSNFYKSLSLHSISNPLGHCSSMKSLVLFSENLFRIFLV